MRQIKSHIIVFSAIIFLLMVGAAGFCTIKASGRTEGRIAEKQAVLVEVKQGDSLWSIARSYYSGEFKNMNRYIEEIKATNGLKDNTIYYGKHLIIPCYKYDKKMNGRF